MVCFDSVVGVLLGVVHRGLGQLVEDSRVGMCPVRGDLDGSPKGG